jgi:hypothetical protein
MLPWLQYPELIVAVGTYLDFCLGNISKKRSTADLCMVKSISGGRNPLRPGVKRALRPKSADRFALRARWGLRLGKSNLQSGLPASPISHSRINLS